MRIKIDENMPATLAGELARLGHDADTVPDEAIGGRGDDVVWNLAQATKRFLITQDLDFSDLRKFRPGTHSGILLVRLREPARAKLIERVVALFEAEPVAAWMGCIVVATDSKLRVRR